jgi:hypothetical protein
LRRLIACRARYPQRLRRPTLAIIRAATQPTTVVDSPLVARQWHEETGAVDPRLRLGPRTSADGLHHCSERGWSSSTPYSPQCDSGISPDEQGASDRCALQRATPIEAATATRR